MHAARNIVGSPNTKRSRILLIPLPPRKAVLTTPENYEDRFAAYKTYIKTTATLVAESLGQVVDEATLDADVDAMVEFEIALANI